MKIQIRIPLAMAMVLCLLTTSLRGEDMTLKKAFSGRFQIGSAFGHRLFEEEGHPTLSIIQRQFNTVSPENALKWASFNPKPGVYNFKQADAFVEFGEKNNLHVVGHVLFWHNQTPSWVFEDSQGAPLSRVQLLDRMREHVRVLARRYQGRIHVWDVVNEAFLNNGNPRNTKWAQIIGDDFIEQAFRIAAEELGPEVELLYNDYSMTARGRRTAVVKMIQDFKRKGVRIDGVGMQGHWSLNNPSIQDIEASILAFAQAGVAVHITELDLNVLPSHPRMWDGNADVKLSLQQDPRLDPYKDGLPDEIQKKLANRYAEIFRLLLKHQDKIHRVTFWGPTDKYSWLNNWPIKGRTNYPLLFDRSGEPKPAYHAVIALANEVSAKSADQAGGE